MRDAQTAGAVAHAPFGHHARQRPAGRSAADPSWCLLSTENGAFCNRRSCHLPRYHGEVLIRDDRRLPMGMLIEGRWHDTDAVMANGAYVPAAEPDFAAPGGRTWPTRCTRRPGTVRADRLRQLPLVSPGNAGARAESGWTTGWRCTWRTGRGSKAIRWTAADPGGCRAQIARSATCTNSTRCTIDASPAGRRCRSFGTRRRRPSSRTTRPTSSGPWTRWRSTGRTISRWYRRTWSGGSRRLNRRLHSGLNNAVYRAGLRRDPVGLRGRGGRGVRHDGAARAQADRPGATCSGPC